MSLCSGTSYALCRAKGLRRRLQPHRCAYVPTEGKGRGGAPMRMESEELSAETASTDACASGSLAPRSLEGSKLAGERTVRDPKKSHQLCLLPARLHDGCRQQTDRGDVEGRCREVNDHEHELSTLRHASQVTCTDESTVYNGREAEGGTLATTSNVQGKVTSEEYVRNGRQRWNPGAQSSQRHAGSQSYHRLILQLFATVSVTGRTD